MLSVTSLTAYLYCARKLYLQKVLGYEEIPKEFLVRGAIKHRVFEEMEKLEKELVCSIELNASYEHILDLYSRRYAQILRMVILQSKNQLKLVNLLPMDAFKQYIGIFKLEAELRASNIFSFMQKNNVCGEALWESLTPKLKSEYKVASENLYLTGKIDQVQVFSSLLVPVEIKTGKAPKEGAWEDHKIQLAAYALLLEDKFKTPVNSGIIRYVDDGEARTIEINPFLKDQVKGLVKEVKDVLSSDKLPPFSKNENKCKNCGLKKICHSPNPFQKAKDLNMT
ncbi:MAG: CRISPR-associated protein Cas4 [Candidatus Woesearchaeota archaeon]